MKSNGPRFLFLGKAGELTCERAAEYLSLHAPTRVEMGQRGDLFPVPKGEGLWDYLISYLSPWIVPQWLLEKTWCAAVNFHPGPPEYPGIGCTNFALYEGATRYGVTCHSMERVPDTGSIIRAVYFPLYQEDTVLSLTHRCYAHLSSLFYEMADRMLSGASLPTSEQSWTRRPFRRAELDALCRLTPDMSSDEVKRRIRATTFPGYPSASQEPSLKVTG